MQISVKRTRNPPTAERYIKWLSPIWEENRKRTVLVIVSLSLSVILMNSVVTMTESFDLDKYLSTFVDTDFLAAHAQYFNNDYRSNEERVSESYDSGN